MAIGFTPKYSTTYDFTQYTEAQFLALAAEAVKAKGWRLTYLSRTGLMAYTDYGFATWNGEIRILVNPGQAVIESRSAGNDMIDFGRNKKTVNKFIEAVEVLSPTLSAADLDERYAALEPTMVPDEEDILVLPPPTKKEQFRSFLHIFRPAKGYFITPLLIDLNILLFIIMAFSGANIMEPDNEILLKWGANFKPLTLDGQWWRLLTNCFLHIGIIHLLMNMYALMYIGMLLEPLLGRARFLSSYLLAGIAASVASLWWHDLTVSAGASGAIFGMFGLFIALLTTNIVHPDARKGLLTSMGIFVGYNLLFGLKGGIDNAAHIGGLISGILLGYAQVPSIKKPETRALKYGTIALLAILVGCTSFMVYHKIPNDYNAYDAKIKTFSAKEAQAMEVFKLADQSPDEKILQALATGITCWQQNIALCTEMEQLRLPDELKKRAARLEQYSRLRLSTFQLLEKAVTDKTNLYDDSIRSYNGQIEQVMEKLNKE